MNGGKKLEEVVDNVLLY